MGKAWQTAFEFLFSLDENTEEKKYYLQGEDMFAMVTSYETRSPEIAVLESHRKYLDIQTVIKGREGMAWFPASELAVKQPYDEQKDVEFYHCPDLRIAHANIFPGIFAVFFPHDAHMPSLMIGDVPECVKKVVVKVNVKLLNAQFLAV